MRTRTSGAIVVALATALAAGGCQQLAGFTSRAVPGQPDGRVDAPSRDSAGEEGPMPDAADDRGCREACGDGAPDSGPAADATWDVAPEASDAVAEDLENDLLSLDGFSQDPCGGSATLVKGSVAQKIVICADALGATQCKAANRCNGSAGWTMCSASQYALRAAAVQPAPMAWIASCIREATVPTPFAPTDSICSGNCTNMLEAGPEEVAWSCPSLTPISSSASPIGVIADAGCYRLGENDPSTEGFWQPRPTNEGIAGTVCCLP